MIDATPTNGAVFVEIDETENDPPDGIVGWAQEAAGSVADSVKDAFQWWVDSAADIVPDEIEINAPGANPDVNLTPLAIALTVVGFAGIGAYLAKK